LEAIQSRTGDSALDPGPGRLYHRHNQFKSSSASGADHPHLLSTGPKGKGMVIDVRSFGYKYGIPIESDLVFDVRFSA
jgi:hypothetical protein